MARITVEEAQEFTTFPADSILHLKVEEVEVRDVEGRNGSWQKLEWKFKILGIQAIGDGSPVENYESQIAGNIWGSCSFKLTDHPENKLRLWAEATLNVGELGIGFELDTDHFLQREVRGITSTYQKKGKDKSGNHYIGQQIESLLPMGAPVAGQVQQQVQQDPWATPQQQPQAAPQQPVAAGAPDPWGNQGWGSGDEPPF